MPGFVRTGRLTFSLQRSSAARPRGSRPFIFLASVYSSGTGRVIPARADPRTGPAGGSPTGTASSRVHVPRGCPPSNLQSKHDVARCWTPCYLSLYRKTAVGTFAHPIASRLWALDPQLLRARRAIVDLSPRKRNRHKNIPLRGRITAAPPLGAVVYGQRPHGQCGAIAVCVSPDAVSATPSAQARRSPLFYHRKYDIDGSDHFIFQPKGRGR